MSEQSNEIDSSPVGHVRWWHSSHGAAHLELLATPSAKISPLLWTKLTREESDRCEEAWQALTDEEKKQSQQPKPDQPIAEPVIEDGEEDLLLGVPIGKERLFEVDVKTMTMYPVFWKLTGPPIMVRRVLWMYDSNRPVDEPLAQQLEDAYQTIKPWKPSYQEEVSAALQVGPAAYEKLKYPLAEGAAFFDDAGSARLISNSFANRVSSAFFSTLRGGKHNSPYPASPLVYRGYDEAVRRANVPSRPASASPSRASSLPPNSSETDKRIRRKSLDARTASRFSHERGRKSTQGVNLGVPGANQEPNESENLNENHPYEDAKVGEGPSEDVSDLIFVVHGIGQGLSAQYESYNFMYMVNLMRIVARKQAMSPALNSIMRSNNVQFLPILWRTNFKPDEKETKRRAEEGLDNSFSLADITLKQHIPMVRELTNEVLIDIPYFMSHHQTQMIEAVCYRANRAYRLWCARNPSFAKNGRVHVIAHSLGAPLCATILSSQPTKQPPLEDLHAKVPWNQFLFNVSALFMLGSPFAVFLHISQAQLIARKGRERTMHSPDDEALDRPGLFGCMAIDSLYNVFQLSDPIAYKLNACVDAARAHELPPIPIPSITGTLLESFQKGVSKMFDGFLNPFVGQSTAGAGNVDTSDSPFELGGGPDKLQGSRAERRFSALNPHGALDFYLPGDGNISEYVAMMTSHSSYWRDESLSAFILSEIFARQEDLARTGLGPTIKSPVHDA
ncbi:hypothetical protein M408DRAFT_328513 [Serendipita vermifera MAFF 305830]|uniref:DDHD domain-containing protein n=1 Tax=Serendipita vermifera MAFF 305830 TaxID=933852 RepID=A0A0C3B037_SERVB|nr:hypothetical protein M408DRAFT_328513 [Serendipita vermifera MAFF 305830]